MRESQVPLRTVTFSRLRPRLFLTLSEDRKEVEPYQADDGCSQGLIDSSQVHLAVEASRQVGKVHVVFVHQVFQHHVQEA